MPPFTEAHWIHYLQQPSQLAAIANHDAYWDEQTGVVLTTDMLIEGVHFRTQWQQLEALGYKAIAVNISDLAATGADPQWVTIALGVPASFPVESLETLYKGVHQAVLQYNCKLVGGDTTAAEALTISVTAVGLLQPNTMQRAVGRRDAAQAGDVLMYVGLPLGLSKVGLSAIETQQQTEYPEAVKQQLRPQAQLQESTAIAQCLYAQGQAVVCMMDTSDGLADAVLKLAHASSQATQQALCFTVDAEQLCIHPEVNTYASQHQCSVQALQLYGGEDYGLLLTVPENHVTAVLQVCPRATVIGAVRLSGTHQPQALLRQSDGSESIIEASGCFQHHQVEFMTP